MIALDSQSVVVSVFHLSHYLKDLLDTDDGLQDIWVQGEVSGCKTYPSGHCYFTLKDANAQLPCVFFKYARLRSSAPELRDGMAVIANGRISLYERDGKLQLYVECIQALGDGDLFLRFEQLKACLAAEGLFDLTQKRPLPLQPAVIGIVTSPQGAVLHDMLHILDIRYPLAEVILAPTPVQGAEAATSIARALDLLNEQGTADVIILGRGGGSIEELWAFNEEVVARAIARSRIPVISAVGHETDFTIADFVADQRAATPTAAAVAAVPDIEHWRNTIDTKEQTLIDYMKNTLHDAYDTLDYAQRDLQRTNPQRVVDSHHQRLDEITVSLQRQMQHRLALDGERLHGLILHLHSLSPLLTIARGYAIVRRSRDDADALITSTQQVQDGDLLTIQVSDGHIPVRVDS